MTMELSETVTCAVCRNESPQISLVSTNQFGSPDLDTRPPEMARSTMWAWVQRCPHCGYCAENISSTAPPNTAELIKGNEYRQILEDPDVPDLAASFQGLGILEKARGDLQGAVWSNIHAAWVCDDEHFTAKARELRLKAVEILSEVHARKLPFGTPEGALICVMTDLLRRAGEFGQARELISAHARSIDDEMLTVILGYQEILIRAGDSGAHTVQDAELLMTEGSKASGPKSCGAQHEDDDIEVLDDDPYLEELKQLVETERKKRPRSD